jgi:hypothetical protein
MKSRGFSLLELLVLPVVAGIVGAAQAAYSSVNRRFYDSQLSCLVAPSVGCIPNYPTTGPTLTAPWGRSFPARGTPERSIRARP